VAGNKQLTAKVLDRAQYNKNPVQGHQQTPVQYYLTDSGALVPQPQTHGADSGASKQPPVQYYLTDSGADWPPPAYLKRVRTRNPGRSIPTLPEIKIYRIGDPRQNKSHIRPAWYGLFQDKVFAASCEVDTGADCNVMPLSEARRHFGSQLELAPPNVSISAFGDKPVNNLGSMIIYMHVGDEIIPVECELCDVDGPLLLGRVDSLKLGYVTFPELVKPAFTKTVKTVVSQTGVTPVTVTQSGVTAVTANQPGVISITQPVIPITQSGVTSVTQPAVSKQTVDQDVINKARALDPRWSKPKRAPAHADIQQEPVAVTVSRQSQNSVIVDGTSYHVPTTKEFLLSQFSDVFDEIGRLPGPQYHIQLKEGYQAVQHRSRIVPHSIRQAYKEQLDKLVQERVITPVTQFTEWVNSIVPVTKADGSL
jgi:hypothetical protein